MHSLDEEARVRAMLSAEVTVGSMRIHRFDTGFLHSESNVFLEIRKQQS